MLKRLFRRRRRAAAPSPPSDWKARNEALIAPLRRQGFSIGSGYVIFTDQFSLEPCLVEIGDRVAVAGGTVADGTVVMGNPAHVVGRTSLLVAMMDASPDTLDTYTLPEDERQRQICQHFGRPEPGAT